MRGRALWVLAGVGGFAWPGLAGAAPLSEVPEEHPGHHHAKFPNLVGLRIAYVTGLEDDDGIAYQPGIAGAFSYERTLIHEWLELELSVPVAVSFGEETSVAIPLDLHFKKPFHPNPRFSPYIALGPSFDVLVSPETAVFFGGSLAVGTYIWPTRRVGIDVELDYNVVAEEGRPVHELMLGVGPVFRF